MYKEKDTESCSLILKERLTARFEIRSEAFVITKSRILFTLVE